MDRQKTITRCKIKWMLDKDGYDQFTNQEAK